METETIWDDGAMSVNQVCEFLSRSRTFVYNLMNTGILPYRVHQEGGNRRIAKRAVVRYLLESEKPKK